MHSTVLLMLNDKGFKSPNFNFVKYKYIIMYISKVVSYMHQ